MRVSDIEGAQPKKYFHISENERQKATQIDNKEQIEVRDKQMRDRFKNAGHM
mgnify:CR=1 FL=1